MPDRPKKKRIRASHEPKFSTTKISRSGAIMTCHNCCERGHNKTTCKKDPIPVVPKEKGKPGRPNKLQNMETVPEDNEIPTFVHNPNPRDEMRASNSRGYRMKGRVNTKRRGPSNSDTIKNTQAANAPFPTNNTQAGNIPGTQQSQVLPTTQESTMTERPRTRRVVAEKMLQTRSYENVMLSLRKASISMYLFVINMHQAIVGDIPLTKSYIPKVSETPDISPTIANFYKPIKDPCIHEGRVVDQLYYTSHHIDRCFSNVRLNYLYEINEPIVPHFILDFYSQVTLQREESAVFTNEWDLSSLEFFQETEGPYYTDLPTPDEIHQFLRYERVDSNRTIKNKSVTLTPNKVLTKEVREDLKPEQQYNPAYFFVKRIESAKATPKAHLPYGMFLTRIFRYVMEHYPHLDNRIYNVVDRVMSPIALKQTRKPRSDRRMPKARHSVSSSFAHHYGSSSCHGDDDEDDGTSRASTTSPTTFLNFIFTTQLPKIRHSHLFSTRR
ncbi:hypothetical protein Tco_1000374 [Tanacetum coccineum]